MLCIALCNVFRVFNDSLPDLTASVMCFCSTIHLGWNEHIFLNEEHFPPSLVLIVVENEPQPEIKINLKVFLTNKCTIY
jgi:hypothetical protein